jgi:hypothetical protein
MTGAGITPNSLCGSNVDKNRYKLVTQVQKILEDLNLAVVQKTPIHTR